MTQQPLFRSSDHARDACLAIIRKHRSDNPVKIATLSLVTGLNEREVKALVSHRRKAGEPICSRKGEPAGYWVAQTPGEIRATAEELRVQARDTFSTIGKMLGSDAMDEMLGQTRMELVSGATAPEER